MFNFPNTGKCLYEVLILLFDLECSFGLINLQS